MSLTDKKFWTNERERLTERRDALTREADGLNSRLTEIVKEVAMLEDVIRRLTAHLPVEAEDPKTAKLEIA